MILSEFIKGRNVKINAVSNYISRNPELFEGHIRREGKNTYLGDEAVRILDAKYPLPKPAIVINGVPEDEHRAVLQQLVINNEKLAEAREIMLQMQEQLTEQKLLAAEAEHRAALIEAGEQHKTKEIETLKEELAQLKNRGLWDRIRNRI